MKTFGQFLESLDTNTSIVPVPAMFMKTAEDRVMSQPEFGMEKGTMKGYHLPETGHMILEFKRKGATEYHIGHRDNPYNTSQRVGTKSALSVFSSLYKIAKPNLDRKENVRITAKPDIHDSLKKALSRAIGKLPELSGYRIENQGIAKVTTDKLVGSYRKSFELVHGDNQKTDLRSDKPKIMQ